MRKTELKRTRMRRQRLRRDWGDAHHKVTLEGCCRGCGRTLVELRAIGRTLDAAHTIGRTYDPKSPEAQFDRYVHPASVIALCGLATDAGTCHNLFDGHTLNMWSSLKDDELAWAIERVGEGQARRKIEGRPDA